jgi:hypothetical protein
MAVWNLRSKWDASVATADKLALIRAEMMRLGTLGAVLAALRPAPLAGLPLFKQREPHAEVIDAVSF